MFDIGCARTFCLVCTRDPQAAPQAAGAPPGTCATGAACGHTAGGGGGAAATAGWIGVGGASS